MIDCLVSFALRKRLVVAMICVFVGIYGYYSWTQLAIEAYPDIADTESQVVTQAPGLAAEEVEQQITIPLERELNGTPGLPIMRSRSTFGLSLITLVFRDGIEDYWSRQRIDGAHPERDAAAGPDARPRPAVLADRADLLLHARSPTPRTCASCRKSSAGPSSRARSRCRASPTSRISAASPRSSSSISIRSSSCASTLSLSDITDAINANNANAGGSVLNRGELGYVVRGIGLVQTLDDLGNIVVTQRNGTPILVRDLGKLKLSNQERHGIVGKDDKNDVVEGTVLLLRDENPSRVLDGIHAKVAELNAQLKADDVQIVPYIDRTDLVDATIDKVGHTMFQGIGLVLIVLILFLGSPRSALIVGITIPFAM